MRSIMHCFFYRVGLRQAVHRCVADWWSSWSLACRFACFECPPLFFECQYGYVRFSKIFYVLTNLSMYWPIYPCIDQSIHVLTNLSMYWPIYPCIDQCIHVLTNLSMYWPIYPCIDQCIYVLTNVSMYWPMYLSMYWPIYLCIDQSIYVLTNISMYWPIYLCIDQSIYLSGYGRQMYGLVLLRNARKKRVGGTYFILLQCNQRLNIIIIEEDGWSLVIFTRNHTWVLFWYFCRFHVVAVGLFYINSSCTRSLFFCHPCLLVKW